MAYIYDLTDTWSAAGTVFNGIKLNVTNTASAAASKLITLQIGGTEHFSVTKAGVGYFSGNLGIGTSSPTVKLDVLVADGAEATKLRGATGRTRIRPYVDATNGSFIDAVNTAENAYIPLSLAGSSIRLTTNVGLAATIDGVGNVGIGTSSPASPLDVQTNSSALGIAIRGRASDNVGSLALRSNDGATIYGQVQGRSTDFRLEAGSSNILTAYTASAERARIDASGNLLVGTTTALGRITLQGNTDANIDTWIRNDSAGSSARAGIVLNASGNSWRMGMGSSANNGNALTWNVDIGGANTERMRIDTSGNVGIGTSSPSQRLDATVSSGTEGDGLAVTNMQAAGGSGGYGSGINFYSVRGDGTTKLAAGAIRMFGSASWSDAGSTSSNMRFYTVGANTLSERMRIDASGNVLVGTTSSTNFPSQGITLMQNTSIGSIGIGHANGTSDGNGYLNFSYNGTGIGSVTQSGSGTAVLYNTSSDSRLKKNIADADDAASLIDAIQVRKFDWKADGNHQRYGFVAQELVTVAPEAVSQPEDPDAMMGVDYSKLVPMLVKELQSVRARLAQLEGN